MANTETNAVQHQEKGPSALDLFSIDPGLILWTWITFIVIVIVLKKFAWKPLAETVAKREKMISDAVDNAKKTKEALENISEEQKRMRAEAENQAQGIIRKAREAGEEVAKGIEDKAKSTANSIVQDAREQINREKETAIAGLKEEAVEMVIQTSSKLVEESLDDEGHRKIIKRHLEAL